MENAFRCCKCQFGPMLLELYPSCIECGAPACSSCRFTSLPERQQGASEEATENVSTKLFKETTTNEGSQRESGSARLVSDATTR